MMRLAILALVALQQGPKEQLRTALKDTEVQGAWIYDDLDAGFAEAKKTGRPMLVVFR
jgi:hypothetical protein